MNVAPITIKANPTISVICKLPQCTSAKSFAEKGNMQIKE